MCKPESNNNRWQDLGWMGLKVQKEKLGSGSGSGSAISDLWGPRVLKGWPSCFTHDSVSNSRAMDVQLQS
ncbi:hypothetical protein L195_g050437, partial [Trifolium pratense]